MSFLKDLYNHCQCLPPSRHCKSMSLVYKKLQQAQPAPVNIHPANPRVKAMFKWALWYQCFKYFWQVLNIISSLIYFWQVWNMFLEFQLWYFVRGRDGVDPILSQWWVTWKPFKDGFLSLSYSVAQFLSSFCLDFRFFLKCMYLSKTLCRQEGYLRALWSMSCTLHFGGIVQWFAL